MNDGTAMTVAMTTARQRQLDWLLDEVLGAGLGSAVRARAVAAHGQRWRWLMAAAAVAAVLAFAFGRWRDDDAQQPVDTPTHPQEAPWTECHGPAGLDAVPADTTSLRCFDFDDAACAGLARLQNLQQLDLSGMDVDRAGTARSLQITDAGVRSLGSLTKLRWLSLGQCEQVKGDGLAALEALPLLEHLDLHYTCIESPAVERLVRLPSLRWLSLSYCTHFQGRSLAAIATLPGLTHLELRGCTTLAAVDVASLAKVRSLRFLDLRDCQGRYRGQTMDLGGAQDPDRPTEDGIGVTDAAVEALAGLPLDTLVLGGCESLTSVVGTSLAKMTTLRTLDLSELPRVDDRLLTDLPAGLTSLSLRDTPSVQPSNLPPLPNLRTLDVTGASVSATDVARLFAGRAIEDLCLGGSDRSPGLARGEVIVETLRADVANVLTSQPTLRRLSLRICSWLDAAVMAKLAALPLQSLELEACRLDHGVLAALARNTTLQTLRLRRCSGFDPGVLLQLNSLPLRELDLTGTTGADDHVREIAPRRWHGCTVTLCNSSRFRTP